MVEARYLLGESYPEKLTNDGHKCLKSTKPNAGREQVLCSDATHGESLADGYRKGVHRESDCQYRYVCNSHIESFRFVLRELQI